MDEQLIPAGKYVARAETGIFKEASTGTPEFRVKFKIVHGSQEGQEVWGSLFFSPRAAERSMESCVYMGMTPEDVANQDVSNLGAQNCQIVVEHSEYNGNVEARVAFVNNLRGPAAEVSEKTKNAFAAAAEAYKAKAKKGAVNDAPPF